MGEAKIRRERGEATRSVHQLRITLGDSDPPIWRRVRVRGDITLAELHDVIQSVMPWNDSHLHRFDVGGAGYGPGGLGLGLRDEEAARLRRVAPGEGDVIEYEYDFGDGWEHEIVVEAVVEPEPGERYPVCLAGERAAPPDDSGGVFGYMQMLEALSDPEHPSYADYADWLDAVAPDFDPEAFDLAAANRRLAWLAGGLSSAQLRRLVNGAWEGEDAVVRIDESLPLGALEASDLLVNARAFLATLIESDGVKATAAGNLTRAVVAELMERLRLEAGYIADVRRMNKVINEQDVWPLHIVRVLLEVGGLIQRRKGVFRATRRGRALVEERRAGELYAHLFRTHFQELNLAYVGGPEAPLFQRTIAATLFFFGQKARDWMTPEELAPEVILPQIYQEYASTRFPGRPEFILETQLLMPLEEFGLAEAREAHGTIPNLPAHRYRASPLFDRVLSFSAG